MSSLKMMTVVPVKTYLAELDDHIKSLEDIQSKLRKQAFRDIRLIDAQLAENYAHPFNGLVWKNHQVLWALRNAAFKRVRS